MHAVLLFGGTTEDRFHQALETAQQKLHTSKDAIGHHPDAFLIMSTNQETGNETSVNDEMHQETPITIATVRLLKTWLSRTPLKSPQKVVLIENAQALTVPAQHALLKSLEEPPAPTQFILTTPNPNLLLATIRSRCQLVKIKSLLTTPAHFHIVTLFQELSRSSPGEKILLARNAAMSKDTATTLCRQILTHLRIQAKQSTIPPLALETTARSLRLLAQNVNPKLVVEDLFLRL